MKKMKRIIAFILAFAFVMGSNAQTGVYAQQSVQPLNEQKQEIKDKQVKDSSLKAAEENKEQTTQANAGQQMPELPSKWALWDVQSASLFGVGDLPIYNKYTEVATKDKFLNIQASLEKRFKVVDSSKIEKEVLTRGDVILELFDIIKLAVPNSSKIEAIDYFVQNGLISGRGVESATDNKSKFYLLDELCTNEEMFVFSKRVFEHIAKALNMDSKGLFWKVSDKDNSVYLLGTVHMANPEIFPFSDNILNAFESSKALYLELNVLVPNMEDQIYVQQKSMLEGDQTLDKLISEKNFKQFSELAEKAGLKKEVYNKFKPWFARLLATQLKLQSFEASKGVGVDMYLAQMALLRQDKKEIREVEGMKYQIDLFDSFSATLQEGFLESALKMEADSIETVQNMISAWKSGDAKKMAEQYIFDEKKSTELEKEFNNKLLEVRDKRMAEYVKSLLDQNDKDDFFFAVGALHMVKDTGIVKELEKMGYKVEVIK